MSNELMPWLVEANIVTAVAILIALAVRPLLVWAFGIRVAILIWTLVPLALIAGALPAGSIGSPITDLNTVIALNGLDAVAAAAGDLGQAVPAAWGKAPLVLWLAGVGLMLLTVGYRQYRYRRLLGALRPLGRHILVSDKGSVGPAVIGVIRPRVILPREFYRRFDARQRRLMLAHEYTHLKRGDPAWNLIATGFRCLFWFNPLVHLASIRFRHDQELACDATVLAPRRCARRAYAAALLAQQDNLLVPIIGFGTHPLKERVRMLAKVKTHSRQKRLAGSLLAVTLVVGMAAVAWAVDPESESGTAAVDERFAFDIEVTVDGRTQTGNLILTGDTAIVPHDGQPRMLAHDTLSLVHRDDESGWAAEVSVVRLPDEKFLVRSTIRKNDQVVATPQLMIGSDAPAIVETGDPETGEIAYRLVLTPVDLRPASLSGQTGSESA